MGGEVDWRIVAQGDRWHDRLAAAAEMSSGTKAPGGRPASPLTLTADADHAAAAAAVADVESELDAEVAAWRAAVDPDDAGHFWKRLQREGLDPAGLSEWLPLGKDGDPHQQAPPWWWELQQMRSAVQQSVLTDGAAQGPDPVESHVAFAPLLAPVAQWNWGRLAVSSPAAARVSDSVREALQGGLLLRLSEVCGQALGEDFERLRPAGATIALRLLPEQADRPHPTEQYRKWCRDHLNDGLHELLVRYPVLGRILAQVGAQWRHSTARLLGRVGRDRALLSKRFGIPLTAPLVDVESGLSDPHRGGQGVAALVFGDGCRTWHLVYKPKDVRIEAQFQAVRSMVGAWLEGDPGDDAGELTVAPGEGDYGYCSYLVHRPCSDEAELAAFYRNAGRLLATLHLLGATDAHLENLIAVGSQLHLIDAETLLQGRVGAASAAGDSSDPLSSSVLRVGMLPAWLLAGVPARSYDISALGVDTAAESSWRHGWAHVNTDDMVWMRVEAHPRQPVSLPVPAGVANPVQTWTDAIVAGFEEVYRAAMVPSRREQLVAAIQAFGGLRRRVVLRATRVYALVQQAALTPASLRSANGRAFSLERLTRSSLLAPEPGPQWQALRAELRDMENLDVPYFEQRLGSGIVESAAGPIAGLLPSDGLQEAVARVRGLSERDLDWQRRIIRGSIGARCQRVSTLSASAGRGAAPRSECDSESGARGGRGRYAADPHEFQEAARAVVADLAGSSVDDGRGSRTWLTLSLLPDAERVQLGLIGDGLYDGRAGVAAFQSLVAGGSSGSGEGATGAAATLAPALRRLGPADDYSRLRYVRDLGLGWSGLGGVLRLADLQRLLWGESEIDDYEVPLLEAAAGLTARDPFGDLLAGVAGLLGPLAARHRSEPTDLTGNLLVAAAGALLRSQHDSGAWTTPLSPRPLTGLAHGAAGMGLALLEAGVALDRPELVDAAARGFAFERAHVSPRNGNWPDFRPQATDDEGNPGFMVAWCHGAAGIGLTRLRALELAPEHPDEELWRTELGIAMGTVERMPLGPADHLCCGNLGRAAVLRIAGRSAHRADWLRSADELTARVLDRAQNREWWALPLDDPTTTGHQVPGLMTGLAGIGAHLSTSAADEDLRVLLL